MVSCLSHCGGVIDNFSAAKKLKSTKPMIALCKHSWVNTGIFRFILRKRTWIKKKKIFNIRLLGKMLMSIWCHTALFWQLIFWLQLLKLMITCLNTLHVSAEKVDSFKSVSVLFFMWLIDGRTRIKDSPKRVFFQIAVSWVMTAKHSIIFFGPLLAYVCCYLQLCMLCSLNSGSLEQPNL